MKEEIKTSTIETITKLYKQMVINGAIIEKCHSLMDMLSSRGQKIVEEIPDNEIATNEQFEQMLAVMRGMEKAKYDLAVAENENNFYEYRCMELAKTLLSEEGAAKLEAMFRNSFDDEED